jgi:hypothetical protein
MASAAAPPGAAMLKFTVGALWACSLAANRFIGFSEE